jgi:hypothetical protein
VTKQKVEVRKKKGAMRDLPAYTMQVTTSGFFEM